MGERGKTHGLLSGEAGERREFCYSQGSFTCRASVPRPGTAMSLPLILCCSTPRHDGDDRSLSAGWRERVLGSRAFLCVCAWCQRVRHPIEPQHWLPRDEVVELPPEAYTHGICPTCHGNLLDEVEKHRCSRPANGPR